MLLDLLSLEVLHPNTTDNALDSLDDHLKMNEESRTYDLRYDSPTKDFHLEKFTKKKFQHGFKTV